MENTPIISEITRIVSSQKQKLTDNALLIDQLQVENEKLSESLKEAEAKNLTSTSASEYEQQIQDLTNSLTEAQDELKLKEKITIDDLNTAKIEYYVQMERTGNASGKFCGYTLEFPEKKEMYEHKVTHVKKQFKRCEEDLYRITGRCQSENVMLRFEKKILKEELLEASEIQKQMVISHTLELENVRAELQDEIKKAQDERIKALADLELMKREAQLKTFGKNENKVALENNIQEDSQLKTLGKIGITEPETLEESIQEDSQLTTLCNNGTEEPVNLQQQIQEEAQDNNEEIESVQESIQEEAQLEARDNENQEIVALQKEILELQIKYKQLASYTDSLRDEKVSLQLQFGESEEQLTLTLWKMQEMQLDFDDKVQQKTKEAADFEEKVQALSEWLKDLKIELENAKCDKLSENENLKQSLSEATEMSSTLQETIDTLKSKLQASKNDISLKEFEIEELRSAIRMAQEEKASVNDEQLYTTKKLDELVETMANETGRFEREIARLTNSENVLQLQLKAMKIKKKELEEKLKQQNVENLRGQLEEELKVSEDLRGQLEEELQVSETLRGQLEEELQVSETLRGQLEEEQMLSDSWRSEFKKTKSHFKKQLKKKEADFNQMYLEKCEDLEHANRTIEGLIKECEDLGQELKIKANSQEKESALESAVTILTDEKQKLEEQNTNLRLTNNRNDKLIGELKAEMVNMRQAAITQHFATEASKVNSEHLKQQTVELNNEIEQLRAILEPCTPTEKQQFTANISSLLDEKRILEEKIGKLEKELADLQANKTNVPEAAIQPSAKPLASRNSEPKASGSAAAAAMQKSRMQETAGRKERRKTAFDEHRMQSCWNEFRDFGTMTDESQLELMVNPLKEENLQLKARIIKEKKKAANEQRKLRRQIKDLTSEIENPTGPTGEIDDSDN